MKIEQILMQPIGTRFNAGTLTIKTCKKTWQIKEVWYHQVIFMDETGEIPADVKIGKYNPFTRGQQVTVIIGAVREAEYLGKPRKILFVDQYSLPTMMVDEFESRQADIDKEVKLIVESKVRCWLGSAFIEGYTQKFGYMPPPDDVDTRKKILEWQDFIMTGE